MGKCTKAYGSEGSLAHHVRLKHLTFYERGDYEMWAQTHLGQAKKPLKAEKRKEARSHPDAIFEESESESE